MSKSIHPAPNLPPLHKLIITDLETQHIAKTLQAVPDRVRLIVNVLTSSMVLCTSASVLLGNVIC